MPNLLPVAQTVVQAVRSPIWMTKAAAAAGSTFGGAAVAGYPAQGLHLALLILGTYAAVVLLAVTVVAVIAIRGARSGASPVELIEAVADAVKKVR